MNRLILTALVGMFITGCATEAKYRSALDTFVGKPESEVISRWGIPAQSYESGQMKLISYMKDDGTAAVMNYGYIIPVQRYCKTTFVINNLNIVESYSFQGNRCKL